jgi:hypothetical protein
MYTAFCTDAKPTILLCKKKYIFAKSKGVKTGCNWAGSLTEGSKWVNNDDDDDVDDDL